MKQCTKCKQWKPRTEFRKDSNKQDGLFSWCRSCKNAHDKAWYEENKERHHAYKRTQRSDPEFRRRESKKDAERLRKRRLDPAYRHQWGDLDNERRRLKRKEHGTFWLKEKIRDQEKRTMRKRGSFTMEEWEALCSRFHYTCLTCGEEKPLTADHIVPLIKGGTNTIDNIQPLCLTCNCKKGTKIIDFRNIALNIVSATTGSQGRFAVQGKKKTKEENNVDNGRVSKKLEKRSEIPLTHH